MAQILRGMRWRIVILALVLLLTLSGSCPAHADTWSSGQVITYTSPIGAREGARYHSWPITFRPCIPRRS